MAQAISLERMKVDISNLVCRLDVNSNGITRVVRGLSMGAHSGSCNRLKFWEISAKISDTVQDRAIVVMED